MTTFGEGATFVLNPLHDRLPLVVIYKPYTDHEDVKVILSTIGYQAARLVRSYLSDSRPPAIFISPFLVQTREYVD